MGDPIVDDKEEIEEWFSEPGALAGATVLFSEYECASYEGKAIVVFERGGKLFEVNGSHCSCHGLEDQWGEEETSWEAIAMRKLYDGDSIEHQVVALAKQKVAAKKEG